jgi:rhamnulokinase
MTQTTNFVAFDLGASSGRAVVGRFDGERLSLEEAHRFANGPTRLLDTLHWDALNLFTEMKTGLA